MYTRAFFVRDDCTGFSVGEEEVFTTLTATRRLLEREGLRPMLLLEDSSMEDFEGIDRDRPNSVVVGLAPSRSDYQHINAAFRSAATISHECLNHNLTDWVCYKQ